MNKKDLSGATLLPSVEDVQYLFVLDSWRGVQCSIPFPHVPYVMLPGQALQ